MIINLFAATDVGKVRDHNEDNFAVCKDLATQTWSYSRDEKITVSAKGTILVVADGMGGTNAGEVASDQAQKSVQQQFNALKEIPSGDKDITAFLKKVIVQAHKSLVDHQMSHVETAGMGTTLVVCWLLNNKAYVAWSGDSRMYIHRAGDALRPFTDDHSLVWNLVKSGNLTAEQARLHPESNIITQSLGDPRNTPSPDARVAELCKGDRILLCSDGLSGMVSDEGIQEILKKNSAPSDTCRELIQAANNGGGTDNITVIVADAVDGLPAPKTGSSIKTSEYKTSGGIGKWLGIAALVAVIAVALWYFLGRGENTTSSGITYTEVNLPAREFTNTGTDLQVILKEEYTDLANKKIDSIRTDANDPAIKAKEESIVLSPLSSDDSLIFQFSAYVASEKKVYKGQIKFLPEISHESTSANEGVVADPAPTQQNVQRNDPAPSPAQRNVQEMPSATPNPPVANPGVRLTPIAKDTTKR